MPYFSFYRWLRSICSLFGWEFRMPLHIEGSLGIARSPGEAYNIVTSWNCMVYCKWNFVFLVNLIACYRKSGRLRPPVNPLPWTPPPLGNWRYAVSFYKGYHSPRYWCIVLSNWTHRWSVKLLVRCLVARLIHEIQVMPWDRWPWSLIAFICSSMLHPFRDPLARWLI